jgi:hypothetical protein
MLKEMGMLANGGFFTVESKSFFSGIFHGFMLFMAYLHEQ